MREILDLAWDSNFFKKKVGQIDVDTFEEFDIQYLNNYDIVYVFSKTPLTHPLLKFIEVKVELLCYLETIPNQLDLNITEFRQSSHAINAVESLAIESGTYSRFKVDPNFSIKTFENLYRQWIQNSINSNHCKIFLHNPNEIISGLITLEDRDKTTNYIGLLSVDPNYRAQGIGSKLLLKAKQESKKGRKQRIHVVTQESNKPAIKLYEKNGFEICKSLYVYHYWNF